MSYYAVKSVDDKEEMGAAEGDEQAQELVSHNTAAKTSACTQVVFTVLLLVCLLFLVLILAIISATLVRIVSTEPLHIFSLQQTHATARPPVTAHNLSSTDGNDTLIHYTPSQAIHCLQQLPGPFLLLGNSIMRGVFAFLNSLVNKWPELTRAQQKALCERDEVSGSYVKNCNFSSFQQSIPIYFDLTIDYCDESAIHKLQSSPYNWSSVWMMVGHYPVEKRYGTWHKEAHVAQHCIPRMWSNWTTAANHTLVYSTPTQVCSDVVWGLPHEEYMGQLYDSVYLYIEPAFRKAGAHIIDFLAATTGNASGPYGCNRYGDDKLHPILLYPRLTNVWLNEVCSGVELIAPQVNETTLFDMAYGGKAGNAPNPSVDSVMPP